MKRSIFIISFFTFTVFFCNNVLFAQHSLVPEKGRYFITCFYNLENLFDTIDDLQKDDNEFLPNGKKMWTGSRYRTKINNIAKVLSKIDSVNMPVLIGVSEVENFNVLKDLINATPLKSYNYKIVHFDSPDPRGIDVALLYRADIFQLIKYSAVPVYYDSIYKRQKTRQILYVKGIITGIDTLHIFVNHWKSRAGGITATQIKRIRYARVLKNTIDSIFNVVPDAKIISVGDYNDEPDDISIKQHLKAFAPTNKPDAKSLYNLMIPLKQKDVGTYCFKGEWNLLDQIIVSGTLLDPDKKLYIDTENVKIFNPDWMTRIDKTTGKRISIPTYEGSTYFGGYSDHFPVYVKVWINNK